MKHTKSSIQSKAYSLPELKFEDQTLTSFSGLVIVQKLFATMKVKNRLKGCFAHLDPGKIFDRSTVFLQLVVHIILGYRELRDSRYYRDDPLVKRLLGLKQLPDVATVSRTLKDADERSIKNILSFLRELVFQRLQAICPARVTLDFDGSVQSTRRKAQGTAVKAVVPNAVIEVRMDSAFFSNDIVQALDDRGVELTLSVPFERFTKLKGMIQQRRRWHRLDSGRSYFETAWKPQCWDQRFRFIFIRTKTKKQQKGPIQLDLFVPYEYGYEFKVIVTNKTVSARTVAAFHEGRGSQEGIFGELKSHCQADYIPVRSLHGNQTYLLAQLLAHNLMRELQIQTTKPARHTTSKRAALWVFEKVDTMRKTIIQRAGRLTRPQNTLTLTVSANRSVAREFMGILNGVTGLSVA